MLHCSFPPTPTHPSTHPRMSCNAADPLPPVSSPSCSRVGSPLCNRHLVATPLAMPPPPRFPTGPRFLSPPATGRTQHVWHSWLAPQPLPPSRHTSTMPPEPFQLCRSVDQLVFLGSPLGCFLALRGVDAAKGVPLGSPASAALMQAQAGGERGAGCRCSWPP